MVSKLTRLAHNLHSMPISAVDTKQWLQAALFVLLSCTPQGCGLIAEQEGCHAEAGKLVFFVTAAKPFVAFLGMTAVPKLSCKSGIWRVGFWWERYHCKDV